MRKHCGRVMTYLSRSGLHEAFHGSLKDLQLAVRCINGELEEEAQDGLVRSCRVNDARSRQRSVGVGGDFVGGAKHDSGREQINVLDDPPRTSCAGRVLIRIANVDSGKQSKHNMRDNPPTQDSAHPIGVFTHLSPIS